MARFKIQFQQDVSGVEHCECVVEADNKEEAYQKMLERNFTIYIVKKQEVDRKIIEDYVVDVERLK